MKSRWYAEGVMLEDSNQSLNTQSSMKKDTKSDRSLILSICFLLCSVWICAIGIQYVTEKVVKTHVYINETKLSDILLDGMNPDIKWFQATEIIIAILGILSILNLFINKNRRIIIKRYCILFGISYCFRFLLFTVTILPVPHTYTGCPESVSFLRGYIINPIIIMVTMGMFVPRVSCGDYLYSGHTAALTLLCFFGRDYFFFKSYIINFILWAVNFIGMFGILKAHMHYTVDVILGFIIAIMLYSSYHSFILMLKIKNTETFTASNELNFEAILNLNRFYLYFEKLALTTKENIITYKIDCTTVVVPDN